MLQKCTLRMCGFDGSEWSFSNTLTTFNLSTLIFWQIREQCCQPSLHLPQFDNLAQHVVFECVKFWFGFSRLLFLFGFPHWIGISSQFIFGQNQNWSKHGYRRLTFAWCVHWLTTLSVTCLGIFFDRFWICFFGMPSSSFCVLFLRDFCYFIKKD